MAERSSGGDESLEDEPWRFVTSRQLKANTVVFPAQKEAKLTDYVQALEAGGLSPSHILSIQVSTAGECRLTLANPEVASKVASSAYSLGSHVLEPRSLEGKTLQLHIHDLPVWVSDSVLESALSPYGTIVGCVQHGKFKTNNVYIATGVRFVMFRPKQQSSANIPSYLRTPDLNTTFRVYHAGQRPTCRLCSSVDHLAKECPNNSKSKKASDTPNTSNSRRWETAANTQPQHVNDPKPAQATESNDIPTVTAEQAQITPSHSTVDPSLPVSRCSDLEQPPSVSSTQAEPPSPSACDNPESHSQKPTTNHDDQPTNVEQKIHDLVASARDTTAFITPSRRSRPSPDSSPEGGPGTSGNLAKKEKKAPSKSTPSHSAVPGSRFSALYANSHM